jgi:hypothetical protein
MLPFLGYLIPQNLPKPNLVTLWHFQNENIEDLPIPGIA